MDQDDQRHDAQIIRHYECAGYCSDAESASNWDLRLVDHHAWGFIRDADKGSADASGGQVFQGTKTIDDGFFHHVALVRDQVAGHARLYVDGTLEADVALDAGASGALSNIDPDADPVTIGGGWLGGTTSPDPNIEFTGVIDEVQWWRNTALSGDQIATMCTDAVTPTSAATAPATGTVGQPITVNYTASDNAGVARVILLVRTPGASGLHRAATDTTGSGSFTYTPTTCGDVRVRHQRPRRQLWPRSDAGGSRCDHAGCGCDHHAAADHRAILDSRRPLSSRSPRSRGCPRRTSASAAATSRSTSRASRASSRPSSSSPASPPAP